MGLGRLSKMRQSRVGQSLNRHDFSKLSLGYRRFNIFTAIILGPLLSIPGIAIATSRDKDTSETNTTVNDSAGQHLSASMAEEVPHPVPPAAPSPGLDNSGMRSENTAQSHVEVRVNGELIPVPEKGSYHSSLKSDNGQVDVNVHTDNSSTGNGSYSYSNTSINSFSTSINSARVNVQSNSSSGQR